MTLSRRDEFAARAMTELIRRGEHWSNAVESAAKAADKLITELDRTTPKTESRPEIDDDGREIRDEADMLLIVKKSKDYASRVFLGSGDPHLTIPDARLFAHRIIKLCDEIEGK